MGRPSQIPERRQELLPIIARAFARLGYRGATTAELAKHCGVRENILYRIWEDKRTMFLAAIQFLFEQRMLLWTNIAEDHADGQTPVERMLEYEARHLGEGDFHRIVFAALTETDDPEIRDSLRRMYDGYHPFLTGQIAGHLQSDSDPAVTAWCAIGLVTILNILKELNIMNARERRDLFLSASHMLLEK